MCVFFFLLLTLLPFPLLYLTFFYRSDGPSLREIKTENGVKDTHEEINLTGTSNLGLFESSREKMLDRFLESLANRFDDEEVVEASHILDIASWPKKLEGKFFKKKYG